MFKHKLKINSVLKHTFLYISIHSILLLVHIIYAYIRIY